jgi:3-oxoacyl-[acyl-carrier-protein] synthase-3
MTTNPRRNARGPIPFPYAIAGTASRIGDVVSTEEWADVLQIPHRSGVGHVDGAIARKVLGINGKSWSPRLFRDPNTVTEVARTALERAGVPGRDLDAVIVVTCTPYEIQLDQDSFRFLRALGVSDDVPPLQLAAGCAGVARASRVAAMLDADNVLIVSYNLPSCYTISPDGEVNPLLRGNTQHPFGEILWASPGSFSDGVAAIVLRRDERSRGFVFYSRDAQSFGEGPGVTDSLVHFPGGGALHPIGFPGSDRLACFGVNSERVKEYYVKGMTLNHELLRATRPDFEETVSRVYTHQASPALVADFVKRSALPLHKAPTHSRELGNLVTPSTIKLLDDDIASGALLDGDEICVSVVGAGPERGVLVAGVEIAAGVAALPKVA